MRALILTILLSTSGYADDSMTAEEPKELTAEEFLADIDFDAIKAEMDDSIKLKFGQYGALCIPTRARPDCGEASCIRRPEPELWMPQCYCDKPEGCK